ncbi:hypothetical protein Dimus_036491, partial [Dionaea muscipula]
MDGRLTSYAIDGEDMDRRPTPYAIDEEDMDRRPTPHAIDEETDVYVLLMIHRILIGYQIHRSTSLHRSIIASNSGLRSSVRPVEC